MMNHASDEQTGLLMTDKKRAFACMRNAMKHYALEEQAWQKRDGLTGYFERLMCTEKARSQRWLATEYNREACRFFYRIPKNQR